MGNTKPVSRVLLLAIPAIIIVILVSILFIIVQPKNGFAHVREVGFTSHGHNRVAYLAHIYIGDEHVRSIYMLIPLYNETQSHTYILPLTVHIPVVKDGAVVKSLKITFTPPLGRILDILAWVVTTFNTDVRYHVDERNVVWQCNNMDFYGKGTITLEFIPKNPVPNYFSGITITISMLLEYSGKQYAITHDIKIG